MHKSNNDNNSKQGKIDADTSDSTVQKQMQRTKGIRIKENSLYFCILRAILVMNVYTM